MASTTSMKYQVTEITAESKYEKANELYVVFSVRGQAGKAKTSVLAHDSETYMWADEVLNLQVQEPSDAELEVAAYTKRTLVPDHLVGEFTVPMPRPGATEKLSGTLSKKGDENGVVRFTVSSTAAGAAPAAGSAAAAGSPQAQPTPTAVARPAAGAAASGTALGTGEGTGKQTGGATGGVSQAAAAEADATALEAENRANQTALQAQTRANQTAAEAQTKSNAVAEQATGRTAATVDDAQQKLEKMKVGLQEGKQSGHGTGAGEPGMSGGQSAYNKAVGMPAEAPTASDAPGFGAATAGHVDAAVGGAAGAVDGPVPPTGQGGTLAGTGASAMQPSSGGGIGDTLRNIGISAATKAQQALDSAKQTFTGSSAAAPEQASAPEATAIK